MVAFVGDIQLKVAFDLRGCHVRDVFDPVIIQQLACEMPPTGFRLILATFEEDLRRLVAEMDSAASAGDLEACRRAAHGLAGAAAGMGACTLEDAARRIMAAGSEAQLRTLVARTHAAGVEAMAALRALATRHRDR